MLAVAALVGCGTGDHRKSQDMARAYAQHDLDTALKLARKRTDGTAPEDVGTHHLRWWLEQGAIHRARGDFTASERAFADADRALEVIDERPELRITEQGRATLSNLAALPYEGYGYDRIMLSTYRALNALSLGDPETARVELNRVLDRQRQAVERNERRIAAAEEEAREREQEGQLDLERGRSHVEQAMDRPEIPHAELYQAQGLYINPFAEFLQGLYFTFAGAASGDREMGVHALRRTAAVVGERNPYIRDDLELAESVAAGGAVPELTYVIFETGRAPSRTQERIDIPLPIRGIDYIGAAFPKLRFHGNHERRLYVEHASGTADTAVVADMDTIVALEFENELPVIITRTLVATAVQAAAHYAVHRATADDALVNLAARVGGAVYRGAMAQADRRTWLTLPKQFQYCRLPTPEDRVLRLRTPTGRQVSATLDEGRVNVVHVKSIRANAPLQVTQFVLR